MITASQAEELIKLARESISCFFKGTDVSVSPDIKRKFGDKAGVFISLYFGKDLCGCIGFPEPVMPLFEGVVRSAIGAAFEDPRFSPLKEEQIKDLRVELSVLTKPKEIIVKNPSEYPLKIKTGVDGLVIKDEFGSGLLLPQVAVEWKWGSEQFLCETCKKAGLSPDCWNNMKRNVYKFQAQIFSEEKGIIVEKKSSLVKGLD